jgi:hypothetical protein
MAFQGSAFQSYAFQTFTSGGAAPVTTTPDGDAYRAYHKRLKRMAQISDERDRKKYIALVQDKAEAPMPDNPLFTDAMDKIVQSISQPEIDFELVKRNTEIAIARIEAILGYYERAAQLARRRRQDDEIIILLSML